MLKLQALSVTNLIKLLFYLGILDDKELYLMEGSKQFNVLQYPRFNRYFFTINTIQMKSELNNLTKFI